MLDLVLNNCNDNDRFVIANQFLLYIYIYHPHFTHFIYFLNLILPLIRSWAKSIKLFQKLIYNLLM